MAGALLYLGFAFVSPILLVAAPLGLFLLFQRPLAREALTGAALLAWVAWAVTHAAPGFPRLEAAWVCLLAGGGAVALLWRPPARGQLLASALLAVTVAATMGLLLAIPAHVGFDQIRWMAARHFGQQTRLVLGALAAASRLARATPRGSRCRR